MNDFRWWVKVNVTVYRIGYTDVGFSNYVVVDYTDIPMVMG